MAGEFIGEFEQMVLLAVLRLGDQAYGWSVAGELEEVAGRSTSSGALYTTLGRLEEKGLLAAEEGDATPERGGRPRRYLSLTPEGVAALRRTRAAVERLWDGVELPATEAG